MVAAAMCRYPQASISIPSRSTSSQIRSPPTSGCARQVRWSGSTNGASMAWRAMPKCMRSSTIPLTFCSSRGVGLSDFAKEKPWRPQSIILEADPPAHTRTRAVLNQVLSATAMKPLRGHFTAVAEAKVDELLDARQL